MRCRKHAHHFAIKLHQFRKQGGTCWLCDEPMDLFQPPYVYGSASWEHVIPKNCGGSDGWQNLVLTHWECNKARGPGITWRLRRPPDRRIYLHYPAHEKTAQALFLGAYRRINRYMRRAALQPNESL